MNGIYIKGMDMPKSCSLCKLKTVVGLDKEKCLVSGVEFYSWDTGWGDEQRRHDRCPLVPVPPHGRLIDADDLCDRFYEDYFRIDAEAITDYIRTNSPTIIPASEEAK